MNLYKSLTWDRGKELADHRTTYARDRHRRYFCDPQSPWQRGSNENTNGLLRPHFPKGTDLSVVFASSTSKRCPSAQRTSTGDLEIRNSSSRDLTPVLRRPVEPATQSGHRPASLSP